LGLETTPDMEVELEEHHRIYFPTRKPVEGIENKKMSFRAGPATFSAEARATDIMTLSGNSSGPAY
jgi:hypothetical protein